MTISDLFKADLSQAVDRPVEPVRAIARNSLAGSRRWDAPRDAPHSRVLECFANFASLFRCDAALREIVHDLIDVPLDGAGRIWLFFVGHRASSSQSSVDSSHPAPAVRSSTRFSGLPLRLWEIFRAISSKKPAAQSETGLRANAAPCKHQLPFALRGGLGGGGSGSAGLSSISLICLSRTAHSRPSTVPLTR
jgi:hypothetical protein